MGIHSRGESGFDHDVAITAKACRWHNVQVGMANSTACARLLGLLVSCAVACGDDGGGPPRPMHAFIDGVLESFEMTVLEPSGRAFSGIHKLGERSVRVLYLAFPELKAGAAECPQASMFYMRIAPEAASIWIPMPTTGTCRLNLDQVAQAAGDSWQGTFSGTLSSTMDPGRELVITDGRFSVLRPE